MLSRVFLLFVLLAASCQREPQQIHVRSRTLLNGIPSASGIVRTGDTLYICGDDAPWLFAVNHSGKEVRKKTLLSKGFEDVVRIPKAEKNDFECIAETTSGELLIFGSGSSGKRNTLRIISPGKVEEFDLTLLYAQICERLKIKRNKLNIEGACCSEDKLWLLNREDNRVIELEISGLFKWLSGSKTFPPMQSYRLKLPKLNGVRAGLSGACILPGTSRMFFTASVEDKPDAVRDGAILGSFIGTIDLTDLKDGVRPQCRQIVQVKGQRLAKAEGITGHSTGNTIELKVVTDNDDGLSELLNLNW